MGISDHKSQQKFPFSYERVFQGLLIILKPEGFNVQNHDIVIGRITASASMSAVSWGEYVAIIVEKIDEANTLITIESSLKVGMNIAGAHRHSQNIERIIRALSYYLKNGHTWQDAPSSSPPVSKRQRIIAGIILASILLIIVVFFIVAANMR